MTSSILGSLPLHSSSELAVTTGETRFSMTMSSLQGLDSTFNSVLRVSLSFAGALNLPCCGKLPEKVVFVITLWNQEKCVASIGHFA